MLQIPLAVLRRQKREKNPLKRGLRISFISSSSNTFTFYAADTETSVLEAKAALAGTEGKLQIRGPSGFSVAVERGDCTLERGSFPRSPCTRATLPVFLTAEFHVRSRLFPPSARCAGPWAARRRRPRPGTRAAPAPPHLAPTAGSGPTPPPRTAACARRADKWLVRHVCSVGLGL